MAIELTVGDRAPGFGAVAIGGSYGDEGATVSLDDLRGQWVVLYFYPKDDTPGCTKQACGLRDVWGDLGKRAAIFGVSIDGAASHRKFLAKYELPFPLLSDESKAIVEAYGVWVEKNMYGRKYMGTERSTFVIDPDGKISSIFTKVKPDQHAALLSSALPE